MTKLLFASVITFFFSFVLYTGIAQAVEPFEAVALPEGWIFATYASYYNSSELLNKKGDVTVSNLDLSTYTATLRLSGYTKALLPNTASATLLVPVGRKDLRQDDDAGLGDITFAAGYWFIDNPETMTYFAAGSYVDMPTGSYKFAKTANMGSNVWKFRPSIGFAKQTGNLKIETALRYNIYTKNEANDVKDGNEFIAEGYAGYFIKHKVLLGWHVNGIFGNEKTFKGKDVKDSEIQRILTGPSLFLIAAKGFTITITALSEVGVRNSTQGTLFVTRFAWRL